MDSDFSFVIISSIQPASSKKKHIRHTKSASTKRKLVVKYQDHSVGSIGQHSNNRKTLDIAEKEEWPMQEYRKENNLNISNQLSCNRMHKETNDYNNVCSSKENSSYESPSIIDLKNVCIRKRQRTTLFCERKYNTRSSCEIIDDNNKSPLKEFKKDSYSESFADDSFKKSFSIKRASRSDSVSSSLTKKTPLFESSNNILQQNSSNHISPEEIKIDPCTLNPSFNTISVPSNDKMFKKINGKLSTCNSDSITSDLSNNRSSLEVSNDTLKHRSSVRLCHDLYTNYLVRDTSQRPKLLGRRIISTSETPEIDKNHLQSSKLRKISSSSHKVPSGNKLSDNDDILSNLNNSISGNKVSDNGIVSNSNNSFSKKPNIMIVKEKLKYSNDTDVKLSDLSAIDSSLDSTQPARRKLQDDFPILFEMNTPKNRRKSQTAMNKNTNNSIIDNLNCNLRGKGEKRKFFKERKITTANSRSSFKSKKSYSPDIVTSQISLQIVDSSSSVSPDNVAVEQSNIPIPKVRQTNNKNLFTTEINRKMSPKEKKQITQDSTYKKTSINYKKSKISEKRKFFKENGTKKCKPAKKANSSTSIKTNQRSSLKLTTPSLSIDKLENINNWLQDTSKHKTVFNNQCEDLYSFHEQEVDKESSNKHIVDEYEVNSSCSSSIICESVGISEDILNKLYGSVWQKQRHEVLPQSEPRKKSKKNTPEKKKQRTSIYDVFSSSSSEDRFEQFLESVHKRNIKPRHSVKKLSTPDFIHDSSESDTSMTFYQSHIAKDIKSEVGDIKNKSNLTQQKTGKHRRLSFTSSTTTKSEVKNIKKASKSKEQNSNEEGKNVFRNRNDTVITELESNLNKHEIDDILKDKENEYNRLGDSENILKPRTGRKSFNTKTKKPITNDTNFLGNILKVNAKPDIKPESKSLGKKEINKNKIQIKSSVMTPVKIFNVTNVNRGKKGKENTNVEMPVEVDILNTPMPESRKPRNAAGSPGLVLSFLSSLSDVTGNLKCHPEAVLYKQSYKKKKEELARKLFNLFNKEIFKLQLPNDMLIQWNARMRSTSGFCVNKKTFLSKGEISRTSRIVLSTKILDSAARLRDTLVHELCHAAAWIINGTSDGHGPNWKTWADRANRRFPELPRIKRCHDYSIKTKYTYKCMGCGYCIGRHSKSLDINRKRCGYCYGQFQIFLTSKVPSDLAPSESDLVKNPRTPSAFAMFVKENYVQVKKENKLPHGEIMKLLGQKFAATKLLKG